MRDRLVLPQYNSGTTGVVATSPNTSATTSPNGSERGGALERGDSILLDIEGGDMADTTLNKRSKWTFWQPDVITSPFRTAVVSNLGSAVSSGWSKARGAILGSSLASYMSRIPPLEKPFDLKEVPSGPDSI